ncbi:MAG: dynamin family protein [Thermoguttaceae bacterium]|jgi:GTP-binding protein EngB required for normal cell division|nr:dynamin family protein [Thermoguttaceae bacterium]
MDITGAASRNALVEWANRLADEVADRADKPLMDEIGRTIAAFESDWFTIAVLGKAKRGKSTLLNVLLGRSDDVVAPVDKLPASSAVSRFRCTKRENATVVFRSGAKQDISFQQIRDFVTEEFNPGNSKQVAVVEIQGPFPEFDRNLELVDTPGAASIHEHHDDILHAFIPQADAVVFLVTARMPLDQDELDLLGHVKKADINKVFFAINRVDESEEADLNDAIVHNSQLLARTGIEVQKIHRISAKQAFQGDLKGSGVQELTADIATFLLEKRGKVAQERFVSRIAGLVQPLAMSLDTERATNRMDSQQLQGELARLRDRKRSLETDRKHAEREFQLSWERAVDEFERGVKAARPDVEAELLRKISSLSVLDVSRFAKEAPTWLTTRVEEQLAPASRKCEEAMKDACEKLQAQYPSSLELQGEPVRLWTREGSETAMGMIGGGTIVAAGTSIAFAGSATAASIAAASVPTTVAAPSILSSVLSAVGLQSLAPLATGTATVAGPVAATPLWVALSGPVGWTLAGVGVLAVPFSWRLSKIRLKDRLEEASREQAGQVFSHLLSDTIPALRKMSKGIVEEFDIRLERELDRIEAALNGALQRQSDEGFEAARNDLERKAQSVAALLDEGRSLRGSS